MPLTLEELVFINEKNEKLPFCEKAERSYTPPLESIPGYKARLKDITKREELMIGFLTREKSGALEETKNIFEEEKRKFKLEYDEKAKKLCLYSQLPGKSLLVQALIDQKVPLFGTQRIKFREIPGVHSLLGITKEEEESGELLTMPIFILFDYLLHVSFYQIYIFSEEFSVETKPKIPIAIRDLCAFDDKKEVDCYLSSIMLLIINNLKNGFCEMERSSNNRFFFTKPKKSIERNLTLRLPNLEEFQKRVKRIYSQLESFSSILVARKGYSGLITGDLMMLDCLYRFATPNIATHNVCVNPMPSRKDGLFVFEFLKNHPSVNPIVAFCSREFLYYTYLPEEKRGKVK